MVPADSIHGTFVTVNFPYCLSKSEIRLKQSQI